MRAKTFLGEFKEFAVKGSVIDLAVGIIIGSAFNKVVTSLVSDIMLPPIGLLLRKVDFSSLYVNLGAARFASLSQAEQAGAPVLKYGLFINSLISFLITALAVFLVVKWINVLRRRQEQKDEAAQKEAATKTCPFCQSQIHVKATRCPACTSAIV